MVGKEGKKVHSEQGKSRCSSSDRGTFRACLSLPDETHGIHLITPWQVFFLGPPCRIYEPLYVFKRERFNKGNLALTELLEELRVVLRLTFRTAS